MRIVVSRMNGSDFDRRIRDASSGKVEINADALHCWTSQQWHKVDSSFRPTL
jgi:hypothetical protein